MATWQGNNGGLLAGVGGVNSNAPGVNDANAALGLIQQNNELQRSGANNVGLQALQGLTGVAQAYQQSQQAERQQAFQQAYANAYASGDRSALRQLAMQFPDQIDAVRKGMGFIDEDQQKAVGNLAAGARLAATSPEAMGSWLQNNAGELQRVGLNPADVAQTYQQNPQKFGEFVDHLGMAALGPVDYFNAQDKIAGQALNRDKLAETVRSNQAGEALQQRGQDISAATARRGQDISVQNSMRSAGGATPSAVREYQYFNSLSPEQQQTYLRVRGRPDAGGDNTVQLSDGRTVTVSGKLHGAGASAFYEGKDDAGNMVRVPASAISAPPTAAATATNYAMKKDLDSIINSESSNLDFMTGVTGGTGSTAVGADIRGRAKGGDQRQLYNAAQRVQGRMQNQGVAAARDMGASGINTVAEAKMYFQSMPQVDYSSPEELKESMRGIQEYTDNYNQQYNVNIGGGKQNHPAQQISQPKQASGYSSLWGD